MPCVVQDVLLINPSQQYPTDKSNDASTSLRSAELNGFAYRSLEQQSQSSSDSERYGAEHEAVKIAATRQ